MAFTPQNVPQFTQTPTTYNFLSSQEVYSGLSQVEPNVRKQLIRDYGWDSIAGWMEGKAGGVEEIDNMEFYHMEKESIREIIKVDADAVPGSVNADKTLTVQSAYRATTAQDNAPYINTTSLTTLPVQARDQIEFPDGTQAVVTAVSGNTFTCYPLVLGTNIPAVTTSTEIIVIGSVQQEGGSSVTGRSSKTSTYTNNLQQIRSTAEITDRAMGTIQWTENLGEGENSSKWYTEVLIDTKNEHTNKEELMLMASKKTTNTTLAAQAGFETAPTTEGMIPWLESNACVETYTAGSFSLDEIDNINDSFAKYRGAEEYEFWTDLALSREVDDLHRAGTGLTAGGVVYSTASKDRYVDYGFTSFTRSGVTYHMKRMKTLDLPEFLGATGHKYSGMGILIPQSNYVTDVNGQMGLSVPCCRIVGQRNSLHSKGYREWSHGGNAGNSSSGEAKLYVEFDSIKAPEFFAPNRWALIKTA